MTLTNRQSGTNVCEIADGVYRINTPVVIDGAGGFSFNQYLIVDDRPLLFHTGLRKMFPLVHEAVASILAPEKVFRRLMANSWPRVKFGGFSNTRIWYILLAHP